MLQRFSSSQCRARSRGRSCAGGARIGVHLHILSMSLSRIISLAISRWRRPSHHHHKKTDQDGLRQRIQAAARHPARDHAYETLGL
jgi:hypothetical protein